MNVITAADRIGTQDPALRGHAAGDARPDRGPAVQRCGRRGADARDPTRVGSRRSWSRSSRTTSAVVLPEPGFLAGCASSRTAIGVRADLRRGHHWLPSRPGRLPEAPGRHARPHHVRQGHGQWLSRSPRWSARPQYMDRFAPGGGVMFAGTYNGHPAAVAAALATIAQLEDGTVHAHTFRLAERAADGILAIARELGIPMTMARFGSVFVPYFFDGPTTRYEDLLRQRHGSRRLVPADHGGAWRLHGAHRAEAQPCQCAPTPMRTSTARSSWPATSSARYPSSSPPEAAPPATPPGPSRRSSRSPRSPPARRPVGEVTCHAVACRRRQRIERRVHVHALPRPPQLLVQPAAGVEATAAGRVGRATGCRP